MRSVTLILAGAALVAAVSLAKAEDKPVNCNDAQNQQDINFCSAKDYEAADAAMNVQWKKTKAAAEGFDKNLPKDQAGAAKALLAAQRSWIAYRDANCDSFGWQVHGGTMESMIVSGCLKTVTETRTKELKDLEEAFGN